jgi:hypothetical protein
MTLCRAARSLVLTSLFALCGAAPAPATRPAAGQLPAAPDGFAWQSLPEVRASVLRPTGWHVKTEGDAGTQAYFISKESIESGGKFETGLTINVIRDITHRRGIKPSEFARKWREALAGSGQVDVEKTWEAQADPFQTFAGRYLTKTASPARMQALLIANDRTGTLYQINFEAPATRWDADWVIGLRMLKQLMLDGGT